MRTEEEEEKEEEKEGEKEGDRDTNTAAQPAPVVPSDMSAWGLSKDFSEKTNSRVFYP